MSEPQPKIIVTEDGSHTLYLEALNETYHSFHGAWQESNHVFVRAGLDYLLNSSRYQSINLLEIGLGTGLNALLTILKAMHQKIVVNYHGIEPFPLNAKLINNLNYKNFLKTSHEVELFKKLHTSEWEKPVEITNNFFLHKYKVELHAFQPESDFDLIYFDAFAPSKQPELWTYPMIKKVTDFLVKGGILVTYCAQGQFKRYLTKLGLRVETLAGPPGKKEMVRALKNES